MIKKITYGILILFGLSIFGSIVKHVNNGGTNFGFFTKPIDAFTSLHKYVNPLFQTLSTTPPRHLKTPEKFAPINHLKTDVLALHTYSSSSKKRVVELKNLKDGGLINRWNLDFNFKDWNRILDPLLLPNKELILNVSEEFIMKVDSTGEIIWKSKSKFVPHHSVNFNFSKKYIWTPGKLEDESNSYGVTSKAFSLGGQKAMLFRDEFLLKWDVESGNLLYSKSITELLIENNLETEIKKSHFHLGPYHINDIQPVLNSTDELKQGDLLISVRNMSSIIHFRPKTDKVIRLIKGPFSFQHDIDFLNDSTITFFNNNSTNRVEINYDYVKPSSKIDTVKISSSQILQYNYKMNSFDTLFSKQMIDNKIFTHFEGIHHIFDSKNVLIEEKDEGIIWIFDGDKVIYKNVIESKEDGYHHMLNWTRVVEVK